MNNDNPYGNVFTLMAKAIRKNAHFVRAVRVIGAPIINEPGFHFSQIEGGGIMVTARIFFDRRGALREKGNGHGGEKGR